MGLEHQMIRLLIAHPVLAADMDASALAAIAQVSSDEVTMLTRLVASCQQMGANARFAALAEQLRATDSDFDALIAEVAAQPESDVDTVRLELAGAVRQTKMQAIKAELDQLATSGQGVENMRVRYMELMAQQEQLRRQADAEIAMR
jgi:DNA primase